MNRKVALSAGGLCLLWTAVVSAQTRELSELYGRGVHAYFAGNSTQAHNLLTSAIDAGSSDPRCYYFRGLNYLRLGRGPEAQADFQQGAKLETADTDRFYNISKSLERAQGQGRLLLEQYRARARTKVVAERQQLRLRRYGAVASNTAEEVAAPDRKIPQPAAPVAQPVNPFASTPATPAEPKASSSPFDSNPSTAAASQPAAASGVQPASGTIPEVPAPTDPVTPARVPQTSTTAESPATMKPAGEPSVELPPGVSGRDVLKSLGSILTRAASQALGEDQPEMPPASAPNSALPGLPPGGLPIPSFTPVPTTPSATEPATPPSADAPADVPAKSTNPPTPPAPADKPAAPASGSNPFGIDSAPSGNSSSKPARPATSSNPFDP